MEIHDFIQQSDSCLVPESSTGGKKRGRSLIAKEKFRYVHIAGIWDLEIRLCMDTSQGLYSFCGGGVHGAHLCSAAAVHARTGVNLESVNLDLSIKMICKSL